MRPGIVMSRDASAIARPAFSTAVHSPYVLVSGFGDVAASAAFGCLLRSSCAANSTLDAG